MRNPQRCCLACVAAVLLLVSVTNARLLDIADPRNKLDHAPLKVDKISFETPKDGRRILATGQPAAAAAAVQQQAPATHEVATASAPAPTPVATAAVTPAAAPAPAAVAPPGVTATTSKPAPIPTKPLPPADSKAGAAVAVAAATKPVLSQDAAQAVAKGLSAPRRKAGDKVLLPQDNVQQMTLQELLAEDAPSTACRWEPRVAGIKWNVGCANKALGGSCNGVVQPGASLCQGQGGGLASIKCLPDGEWGQVDTLC